MLTGGWSRECEHFTFLLTFHYPLSPPSKTPNGATDKPRFQKVRELATYLCTFCDRTPHIVQTGNQRRFAALHPLARQQTVSRTLHPTGNPCSKRVHVRLVCSTSFTHSPTSVSHTLHPFTQSRDTNESNADSFAAFPARYTPQAIPAANESTFDSFAAPPSPTRQRAFLTRYTPSPNRATANESTLDSFVTFLARYTPSPTRPLDSFARFPAQTSPRWTRSTLERIVPKALLRTLIVFVALPSIINSTHINQLSYWLTFFLSHGFLVVFYPNMCEYLLNPPCLLHSFILPCLLSGVGRSCGSGAAVTA
ncbi:hypothetical protein DFH05DRAFT_1195925 [Lentinula detonsa]|uniref:Uncharacterized protein n=1 Tax=Lentinula detonsa TaxID=2804962 RepID=A0A9W8P0G7_9AGAR|nr:hypothetical protein DFH05DRAFT_1195925 [Lentinula detonsa]